jgi:hypothetical protein
MSAKTGVVEGTGKLTGRFCVRAPKEGSNTVKMLGCFKSKAAADKRFAEFKSGMKSEKKAQ